MISSINTPIHYIQNLSWHWSRTKDSLLINLLISIHLLLITSGLSIYKATKPLSMPLDLWPIHKHLNLSLVCHYIPGLFRRLMSILLKLCSVKFNPKSKKMIKIFTNKTLCKCWKNTLMKMMTSKLVMSTMVVRESTTHSYMTVRSTPPKIKKFSSRN